MSGFVNGQVHVIEQVPVLDVPKPCPPVKPQSNGDEEAQEVAGGQGGDGGHIE